MRNYKKEIEPIKEADYQNFEFDIYKINKTEEWTKIKTLKLADYNKKIYAAGSGWCGLFHKKNGQKLILSTAETYDIFMNPQLYGVEILDKKEVFRATCKFNPHQVANFSL